MNHYPQFRVGSRNNHELHFMLCWYYIIYIAFVHKCRGIDTYSKPHMLRMHVFVFQKRGKQRLAGKG